MPQQTITDGETAKLINTSQSRQEVDDELDRVTFLIRVDDRVRFRESDSDQEPVGTDGYARTGVPLSASGTGVTFDYQPRGAALYLYADGANVTVDYYRMMGRIGDFE
jgi:hypothetical protein